MWLSRDPDWHLDSLVMNIWACTPFQSFPSHEDCERDESAAQAIGSGRYRRRNTDILLFSGEAIFSIILMNCDPLVYIREPIMFTESSDPHQPCIVGLSQAKAEDIQARLITMQ